MPIFPKIPLAQLILQVCKQYHINQVVICPGSRNAPLTIGFTKDTFFTCYSIVDERSAAFFAIGMAQQSKKPVVVVCTSGSAVLNFYPAVAEAFYSQIPLIVISADRPKSKIDIGDGQTIRQENALANHTVFNANLSEEILPNTEDILVNAIQTAILKQGPVHINAPFEEPLYETTNKLAVSLQKAVNISKSLDGFWDQNWHTVWQKSTKKLVLVGELAPNAVHQKWIAYLAADPSVVVLLEKTSNLHHTNFIDRIDTLISIFIENEKNGFQPQILLTFGGMVVSKRIKALLRNYKNTIHWHVDTNRHYDTYGILQKKIFLDINTFFEKLEPIHTVSTYQKDFLNIWKNRLEKHAVYIQNIPFSDFKVIDWLSKNLPDGVILHSSNSSVIRYLQLVENNATQEMYCNRGTSGIDGSTSTAIGFSVLSYKQNILVTGDISFFYDSNALWNNYIPKNFKIILINNSGGGIFRILPGHEENETFNTFFETSHQLNARHLSEMYGFGYLSCNDMVSLKNNFATLMQKNETPQILEIFTPEKENDIILLDYFKNL
jgi:2-succinyl-5-enolpyruvyl-6-hydroxy-3-cyclohexene-1-carboxylate synthase